MGRKEDTSTFLSAVDTNQVEELINQTETNVKYFNDTCANILKKYSEPLDNLMSDLYVECIKSENAPTETLEKYFLELSNMIYFMGEKLEQISTYNDMSKSAAKEKYSKVYLENQVKEVSTGKNKTTINELVAQAELGAQYESVVNNIYDHVYQALKFKIEAAKDMMTSLRKILNGRQIEMNMSTFVPHSSSKIEED